MKAVGSVAMCLNLFQTQNQNGGFRQFLKHFLGEKKRFCLVKEGVSEMKKIFLFDYFWEKLSTLSGIITIWTELARKKVVFLENYRFTNKNKEIFFLPRW